jgi:hypothetical protein
MSVKGRDDFLWNRTRPKCGRWADWPGDRTALASRGGDVGLASAAAMACSASPNPPKRPDNPGANAVNLFPPEAA